MTLEEENTHLKARIADLEIALGLRNTSLTARFKLTPASAALLGMLVELPVVTEEVMKERAKVTTDAKVAIYRLRRQLDGANVTIHSRRGTGWWLDEETRALLKGNATPEVTAEAA